MDEFNLLTNDEKMEFVINIIMGVEWEKSQIKSLMEVVEDIEPNERINLRLPFVELKVFDEEIRRKKWQVD